MDPKLSNLDPKLQDAYNRVMAGAPGGGNPPIPTQPQPQTSDPAFTPPSSLGTIPGTPSTDPAIAPPLPSDPGQPSTDPFAASPSTPPPTAGFSTTPSTPPPTEPVADMTSPQFTQTPVQADPNIIPPPPPTQPEAYIPQPENTPEPQVAVPTDPNPPAAPPMTEQPQSAPPPATPAGFNSGNPPTEPTPAPNQPAASIPGVTTTVAFNASNSQKNVGTTAVKKGGLHIMPLVVGLGIIVLLVAYTFVWVMIFNVKVPFLPQL